MKAVLVLEDIYYRYEYSTQQELIDISVQIANEFRENPDSYITFINCDLKEVGGTHHNIILDIGSSKMSDKIVVAQAGEDGALNFEIVKDGASIDLVGYMVEIRCKSVNKKGVEEFNIIRLLDVNGGNKFSIPFKETEAKYIKFEVLLSKDKKKIITNTAIVKVLDSLIRSRSYGK